VLSLEFFRAFVFSLVLGHVDIIIFFTVKLWKESQGKLNSKTAEPSGWSRKTAQVIVIVINFPFSIRKASSSPRPGNLRTSLFNLISSFKCFFISYSVRVALFGEEWAWDWKTTLNWRKKNRREQSFLSFPFSTFFPYFRPPSTNRPRFSGGGHFRSCLLKYDDAIFLFSHLFALAHATDSELGSFFCLFSRLVFAFLFAEQNLFIFYKIFHARAREICLLLFFGVSHLIRVTRGEGWG
jgi:hypothetical protein